MGLDDAVKQSVTADWLEVFDDDVKAGKELADSVFWRLALHTLPEGVNPEDPRVQAALAKIRESVQRRGNP